MSQFNIIWLDANALDSKSSFRSKLGATKLFTNVDSCVKYVESHSNEPIYLIVSGSFAKEVVPKIYDSPNLVQVFLFCGSVAAYAEWAMDYRDKLMIFDHGDDLLERLWNDLQTSLQEQAMACFKLANEYKQRALQFKQSCC
ncbi:unnamed protein product [Rotaria socialis]|uniref:Uncharacterized protein n=1 Tax=Rotaria socialis TaxID=392032 RepID=A0A820YC37_9BILA|nr:unnamed protein product [Rotaria socialis]CAF3327475.1 unnamed protein product [Rotaria socialis]CAF3447432.1 unnamed protein product [Rotaria socialis]CAF3476953.1 unnamed protein product [Rotaria socialis]CAF3504602.1 unnamed protein product [Rotaria socialis]